MKPPGYWNDKTLLEEPPFQDDFLVSKNYVSRSRRGMDEWLKQLAQEIKDKPDSCAAAVRWAEYAFAPDASEHASVASIEVFVRFYWAWYADGERSALKVVNQERKKRGLSGYSLADIYNDKPRRDIEAVNAVTASSSPRRRMGPRERNFEVSDVVANEGMVPVSEVALALQAELAVCDAPRYQAAISDQIDGVTVVGTASSFGLDGTADHTEEDKGAIVFANAHDVETFLGPKYCTYHSAGSIGISVSREETTGEDPCTYGSRPSCSTISSQCHSQLGATISSQLTESQPVGSPPKPRTQRQQKPRPDVLSFIPRQVYLRPASRPDRLTMLAENEHSYHKKAKRSMDDMVIPYEGQEESLAQATSPHRAKKSKVGAPSSVTADSASAPLAVNETSLGSISVTNDKASGSRRAIPLNRRKRSKCAPPRKSVKRIDTSIRAEKRRRGAGSEANAIHILNDAMAVHSARRKQPSTLSPGANSQGQSRSAFTQSSTQAASDHIVGVGGLGQGARGSKCARVISDSEAKLTSARNVQAGARKVVKLPNRKSSRKRLTDIHTPLPSSSSLGIPANLPEMDRMVRNVAEEAIMTLANTEMVADEWVQDPDAVDGPPGSDSEDEEDIPLSEVIAARYDEAHAADRTVASTYDTVNGDLDCDRGVQDPTQCTPSFMQRITLPAIPRAYIPNPMGTHAHRPLPPPPLPKRPLIAQPIIWAKSRQEVCESFDWFRSYQSGVYSTKDLVKGYLLSAFSASRDIFAREGRLIISHGGGKAESVHSNKGQHQLHEASDQRESDKSVRALLATYRMHRPIVLIIDDKYAPFPYDLSAKKDCTYVVLGFYHIANAWAEPQPAKNGRGFVVRYKFAFRWCEKQSAPWWIQSSEPSSTSEAGNIVYPSHTDFYVCPKCSKPSPCVYDQGRMCLEPSCPAFWRLENGMPPSEPLTYCASFLDQSHECKHEELEDITPPTPATGSIDGIITSRRFTKGWHCKACGRLSCRFKWQHWECQNCKATLQVIGKTRSPKEFWNQVNDRFLHFKVDKESGIHVSDLTSFRAGNYFSHYHVCTLPENRGKIYLILGSRLINSAADEIFEEYQTQAGSGELQFRRWPLKSHQCRGELLTNYFSQNTGQPYQYVGGSANTVPFDVAPSAVVKARDLIQSRMMSVLQAEDQPCEFNEVLSAAYMEEQKMAFHSDAEDGLGPRVASLSLGSVATMHFRLLKKYHDDPDRAVNKNVLSLYLRHGDVLIMDGAGVQQYYEHTVVPKNFRIAATARYISSSNH